MGNNMAERLAESFEMDEKPGTHEFILSMLIISLFIQETALNSF
jgi:hypothetical protein